MLCADLISYSQTADNEISALNLTVRRFKQWNKLLEHQRKSLMDESNRKGLLGELIYLCEVIDADIQFCRRFKDGSARMVLIKTLCTQTTGMR